MTMLLNCRCPFPGGTFCDTDCMLSLAHVESSTVTREREETNNKGISCSIAVLASHVASDNHCGGNWLVKAVTYGGDGDERD